MDQEETKQKMKEYDDRHKAAKEVINLLANAGFSRGLLGYRGKAIRMSLTSTPLILLASENEKIIVKVVSSIIQVSTYEEVKKLADDNGWIIERNVKV